MKYLTQMYLQLTVQYIVLMPLHVWPWTAAIFSDLQYLKTHAVCDATQLWMVNHHLQLTHCITCCMCLQVLQLLEDGWGSWPKHEGPSKLCTIQLVVNKFVYIRSLHRRRITLQVKHFILKTLVCFGYREFSCKQYFYCLVWNVQLCIYNEKHSP
jgi:hypothetical protein